MECKDGATWPMLAPKEEAVTELVIKKIPG